jgi:hypothetical protein
MPTSNGAMTDSEVRELSKTLQDFSSVYLVEYYPASYDDARRLQNLAEKLPSGLTQDEADWILYLATTISETLSQQRPEQCKRLNVLLELFMIEYSLTEGERVARGVLVQARKIVDTLGKLD